MDDHNLNDTNYNVFIKKEKDEDLYTSEEIDNIIKESIPGDNWSKLFLYDRSKSKDKAPTDPPEYLSIVDENVNINLQSCDPMDTGRRLFTRRNIVLHPNCLTPLIGCNGAGKSTTLTMIKEAIEESRYPLFIYDNLHDGGHNSISEFAAMEDYANMASLWMSSEGEAIAQNVYPKLTLVANTIKGKYKRNEKYHIFRDTERIFLLMDAVDSGLSIDNLHFLKLRLEELISLAKEYNKYLYIVICANSFEFASGNNCYDVQKSEYIHFHPEDYQRYKEHIMKSRERILKQWNTMAKKKAKEKEE